MGRRWRIAQSFSRRKQQIAACCRCQATSIIINVHHQLLLWLPACLPACCLLPRAHLTHPPPWWLLHANCQFPLPQSPPAPLADLQAATFGIARLQRWQRVIFHHQHQQRHMGPSPSFRPRTIFATDFGYQFLQGTTTSVCCLCLGAHVSSRAYLILESQLVFHCLYA